MFDDSLKAREYQLHVLAVRDGAEDAGGSIRSGRGSLKRLRVARTKIKPMKSRQQIGYKKSSLIYNTKFVCLMFNVYITLVRHLRNLKLNVKFRYLKSKIQLRRMQNIFCYGKL